MLFRCEDIEGEITPLPKPIVGITVDAGRQPQPGEPLAAAEVIPVAGEDGDDLLRRPPFEFPHEADGDGTNQQVKMIGHQDPAVQEESGFLAQLAQDLDERKRWQVNSRVRRYVLVVMNSSCPRSKWRP